MAEIARRLTPANRALVERYLAGGWSPEQIAGRWRGAGRCWISHEAIYQYLYRDRCGGGQLYRWLPQGRKRRRRRLGRARLGGPRGLSITERPAIVARRLREARLPSSMLLGSLLASFGVSLRYEALGKSSS